MLQSKLKVLGQARYLGSHQTCGRVCAIAMLLKGKLLSLTILKTGLCTKGYVIYRINEEVKSTKASYYASAFIQSNGDSSKSRQLINELTSRKKNNASVRESRLNENSVTNSHELSSAFNDIFSTIGTKLANEVPLVTDGSSYADYIVSSNNKFIFSPNSSSNVFSLLNKLSKSKATGLDNISAKLIRECAYLISIPLSNISTTL